MLAVSVSGVLGQVVPLAVLGSCVAAVFLGRRRGRESRAGAIAAAHAEGRAAAVAELRAHQSVSVAVDASHRGGASPAGDGPVLLPTDVAYRILKAEQSRQALRWSERALDADGLALEAAENQRRESLDRLVEP